MGFVIGSSLCLLVMLARRASIKKALPAAEPTGPLIASQWYGHMLNLVAARGFQKPLSHTPMEFARHIERHWADGFALVSQLTELYYRVRFGQMPPTDDDRLAAETLLRELAALQHPIR